MKQETKKALCNTLMCVIMLADFALVPIGTKAYTIQSRAKYAALEEQTIITNCLKLKKAQPDPEPITTWEKAPQAPQYVSAPIVQETPAEPSKDGMIYLGTYKITGYDTCAKCCGKSDGITASGTQATVGRTCAAPKGIAFGTKLYIDGIGERIVEDRGGFASNVIDVLCEDHPACYAITGWYDVYIVEE